MINKVFVYGTLQFGQSNHELIRPYTKNIKPAKMKGLLYDLGPYPVMTRGDGWVTGEVITFDNKVKVLALLDRLEGYIEPNHPRNLYEREIDDAFYADGSSEKVFFYRWAGDRKCSKRLIFLPDGKWPKA